jgi:hypothetical protein
MIIKKSVFIALAFFLFDNQLFCADTVKIHITTKHHIVDGKYTRGMHISNQKFFTNEGQLFREINYDDSTYQIKSYTFYFYKNGKLFTEETFNNNDSLVNVIKYNYDPSGNMIQKAVFIPGKDKPVINEIHDFKYNNHNALSSVTVYLKNKKIAQTKYKYDSTGKLIKEQTVKKTLLPDDYSNESKIYIYNDKGLDTEIEIRRRFQNGMEVRLKELRKYDDLNQILEVKTIDANGNQISLKIYQYLMPGFLNTYEERDNNNDITYQAHFDYKIHLMEMGIQQSLFNKD